MSTSSSLIWKNIVDFDSDNTIEKKSSSPQKSQITNGKNSKSTSRLQINMNNDLSVSSCQNSPVPYRAEDIRRAKDQDEFAMPYNNNSNTISNAIYDENDNQNSFMPSINNNSRMLVENSTRPDAISANMEWNEKRIKKRSEMIDKAEQEEMEKCKSKPTLNKNSEKICNHMKYNSGIEELSQPLSYIEISGIAKDSAFNTNNNSTLNKSLNTDAINASAQLSKKKLKYQKQLELLRKTLNYATSSEGITEIDKSVLDKSHNFTTSIKDLTDSTLLNGTNNSMNSSGVSRSQVSKTVPRNAKTNYYNYQPRKIRVAYTFADNEGSGFESYIPYIVDEDEYILNKEAVRRSKSTGAVSSMPSSFLSERVSTDIVNLKGERLSTNDEYFTGEKAKETIEGANLTFMPEILEKSKKIPNRGIETLLKWGENQKRNQEELERSTMERIEKESIPVINEISKEIAHYVHEKDNEKQITFVASKETPLKLDVIHNDIDSQKNKKHYMLSTGNFKESSAIEISNDLKSKYSFCPSIDECSDVLVQLKREQTVYSDIANKSKFVDNNGNEDEVEKEEEIEKIIPIMTSKTDDENNSNTTEIYNNNVKIENPNNEKLKEEDLQDTKQLPQQNYTPDFETMPLEELIIVVNDYIKIAQVGLINQNIAKLIFTYSSVNEKLLNALKILSISDDTEYPIDMDITTRLLVVGALYDFKQLLRERISENKKLAKCTFEPVMSEASTVYNATILNGNDNDSSRKSIETTTENQSQTNHYDNFYERQVMWKKQLEIENAKKKALYEEEKEKKIKKSKEEAQKMREKTRLPWVESTLANSINGSMTGSGSRQNESSQNDQIEVSRKVSEIYNRRNHCANQQHTSSSGLVLSEMLGDGINSPIGKCRVEQNNIDSTNAMNNESNNNNNNKNIKQGTKMVQRQPLFSNIQVLDDMVSIANTSTDLITSHFSYIEGAEKQMDQQEKYARMKEIKKREEIRKKKEQEYIQSQEELEFERRRAEYKIWAEESKAKILSSKGCFKNSMLNTNIEEHSNNSLTLSQGQQLESVEISNIYNCNNMIKSANNGNLQCSSGINSRSNSTSGRRHDGSTAMGLYGEPKIKPHYSVNSKPNSVSNSQINSSKKF